MSLFSWKSYRWLLSVVIFIGVFYFCESQTKGFRLQEIFTDIPNDSQWETKPVSQEMEKEIQMKLKQQFRYLGSGEQCHAFLGEDQKTVLKFFKHNDFSLMKILNRLPFSLEGWYWNVFAKKYDPRQAFQSCKLAYEKLPEQTGILYLHINKTHSQFPKVTLLDSSGVAHEVDLDSLEFLVQNYCELAVTRIDMLMKKKDLKGAVGSLKAIFGSIEEWTGQGVRIDNPAIRRNIGFYGDKVIMLDAGSLRLEQPSQSREFVKHEIIHVTRELKRWIEKNHPDLYPYFEQEISQRQ